MREHAPGQPNNESWFHVDELGGGTSVAGWVEGPTPLVPLWVEANENSSLLLPQEAKLEQALSVDVAEEALGDLAELHDRDKRTMSATKADRRRAARAKETRASLPGQWRRELLAMLPHVAQIHLYWWFAVILWMIWYFAQPLTTQ